MFLCCIVWIIPWESDFAGFGLFYITELVGATLGGFLIALRLFKVQLTKTFIYNYFGVLNIIMAFILVYFGFRNAELILKGFLFANVLIGAFIIWDIFIKESYPS